MIELILKQEFSRYLEELGYEKLQITSEQDLLINLKRQIENLNENQSLHFSSSEWNKFFYKSICNGAETYKDKLRKIQHNGYIKTLTRDDGSSLNIKLLDKENISSNKLQFLEIHSPAEEEGYRTTILLNGIPLVQIEFSGSKEIREAFSMVSDGWKKTCFGSEYKFFDFLEIFVISTGSDTRYYSCTTREEWLKKITTINYMSNAGLFATTCWSNEKNEVYKKLENFTKSFFDQNNIKEMIINYSVLANVWNEDKIELKIMRPYQVNAVRAIVERIKSFSSIESWSESKNAGGYIWHATGSGKTLTSFKAARLATKLDASYKIYKVLFIVDRIALNKQTKEEYDVFEEGAARGTESTSELWRMIKSSDASKIIITTIQKLVRVVKRYEESGLKNVFKRRMVLIFDECHRSHTWDPKGNDLRERGTHQRIREAFENSYIFGFTGTPLMSDETNISNCRNMKSTKEIFGDELHKYPLYDAIQNQNVLKFLPQYVNYGRQVGAEGKDSFTELRPLGDSCGDNNNSFTEFFRRQYNVNFILKRFDSITCRPEDVGSAKEKRKRGYNSILAVESIESAKFYYKEFKKRLLEENDDTKKLNVTTIFTPQKPMIDEDFGENPSDNPKIENEVKKIEELDAVFLESEVMRDYRNMFGIPFEFRDLNDFKEDVAERLKNKEIDILIVVNMFLTGFDSSELNTLWLDKELSGHNLIQAFSRTNRVSRERKTHGNIVCFQTSQDAVNDALKKYSGTLEDFKTVLAPTFDELKTDYLEHYRWLKGFLDSTTGEINVSEGDIKEFQKKAVKFFKLRSRIKQLEWPQGEADLEAAYNDKFFRDAVAAKYIDQMKKHDRKQEKEGEQKRQDDLILLPSTIDPIVEIIEEDAASLETLIALAIEGEWEKTLLPEEEIERTKENLRKRIRASVNLRDKESLFINFIDDGNIFPKNREVFLKYITNRESEELAQIIEDYRLSKEETRNFMWRCFRDDLFNIEGENMEGVVLRERTKPASEFMKKEKEVIPQLESHFRKFSSFWTWKYLSFPSTNF